MMKTLKAGLTPTEAWLAVQILDRVHNNLSLDEASGEYRESSEDWRLSMSVDDWHILGDATAKMAKALKTLCNL
jgi:hypothetical protein